MRIIEQKIADGLTTTEQVTAISKTLDLTLEEYCMFQNYKSAAVGVSLSLDEANTIYQYLGQTLEHFNNQTVAVKAALTKVFAELIFAGNANSSKDTTHKRNN